MVFHGLTIYTAEYSKSVETEIYRHQTVILDNSQSTIETHRKILLFSEIGGEQGDLQFQLHQIR